MNLVKKCKFCGYIAISGRSLGGHMSNCKSNPNYSERCKKISNSLKGKKIPKEVKEKISKGRRKYLKNNPDKVPYLLNHSRKESYPEKYFSEIFNKNKLDYNKAYRIGLYELDFAIIEKKIDIEIDGEQHYLDKKIVESDKRRNEYLEKRGWDVIRIKWSEYQKMKKSAKKVYINNLLLYVNDLIDIKPKYIIPDKTKYCKCGNKIYKTSKICVICNSIKNRKTKRPEYNVLKKEVAENGFSKSGRKYGLVIMQ